MTTPDRKPAASPPATPPKGLFELAHAEAGQARRLFEVVRLVAKDLVFRSPLPRMAAALAFRTIFGLIPIAVLGLVVLGEVISDEQLESEIARVLEFTGITQIVSEDRVEQVERQIEQERADGDAVPESVVVPESSPANEMDSGNADPEHAVDASPDNARAPPVLDGGVPTGSVAVSPDATAEAADPRPQELDAWIRQIINQVRDVSLRAIGLVGVLVLVYAAFTLIREIERSFNQIYDTAIARSWLASVFVYWTTITLGGLLLLGTFYVGDWIARQLADGLISRGAIELGINSFITMLLLTLAYIGLPNTRVDIRTALGGAFVATVLWQVLKSLFHLYLQAATGYERLYGEIGLIPLFLFWIYLTWLVILFGLQVSFAMQTFGVWRERTLRSRATHAEFVDPGALLAVAVALARRFESGASASMIDLARAAGVGEAAAADLLGVLEDAGLATRLQDQDDLARFSLARPAERIDTAELFQIAGTLSPSPEVAEESDLLHALAAARLDRWRGTTLRDLTELDVSGPSEKLDPAGPSRASEHSKADAGADPEAQADAQAGMSPAAGD